MAPANSDIPESEDEEGWDDVEPDEEQAQIVCLFDDHSFPDVRAMLDHCRKTHGMDIGGLCRSMGPYVLFFHCNLHGILIHLLTAVQDSISMRRSSW